MEWTFLTICLLWTAYQLIRLATINMHSNADYANNADTSLKEFCDNRYLLHFNEPREPFYSPDRKYIWDPINHRWVRNHTGNVWLGFLFGIIITLVLCWILGIFK